MREAFGVMALVAAGFCVYTATTIAFVNLMPYTAIMVGIFAAPAVALTVVGRWLRGIGWRHAFGLSMFWGAAASALVVITFVCAWYTPQFRALVPLPTTTAQSFAAATSLLLACLLLGAWWWRTGFMASKHRQAARPGPAED